MKSLKLLLPIFALAILISYGCSDDNLTSSGQANNPPTAKEYQALINSALASRTQTTTFNADSTLSFTSQKGVELHFPGGCLEFDGTAAKGQVKLTYLELFNKGGMIATNKPTMGLDENGHRKMLVSGGQFYIDMTQNGQHLKISCGLLMLKIPTSLTGGIDHDMILWDGMIDQNGDLTYKQKDSTQNPGRTAGIEFGEGGGIYYAFLNTLGGWTNVDRFVNDPRPKTKLLVSPPKGYNNKNSSVYLSYDNLGNALANLDIFNENKGLFSEHYGYVPIGLQMHIIFVTEDNGQYRYAIKGVTVADGDLYTFKLTDTITGSEQDLINATEVLP